MISLEWERLLSTRRFGRINLEAKQETGRSAFAKDFDRIVFSSAFRRLSRKTQVHPLTQNDHVRTRLTHSIEVASVGRSLGAMVACRMGNHLPKDILPHDVGTLVQAASLAHDIGNPPFGHAGEAVIQNWMRERFGQSTGRLSDTEFCDLANFDGNAQGLRLLTRPVIHPDGGGLRLCCATLATMLKYPWVSTQAVASGKFCVFESEQDVMQILAEVTGLFQTGTGRWCRHPLSHLVEAADDICYGILDLEDAVEVGLLSEQDVMPLLEAVMAIRLPGRLREGALPLARGRAMEALVLEVADAFVGSLPDMMSGDFDGVLMDEIHPEAAAMLQAARDIAEQRIFRERGKLELELACGSGLRVLLDVFFDAMDCLYEGRTPSFQGDKLLALTRLDNGLDPKVSYYTNAMKIMDFISGMTDNYAHFLAAGIQGYSGPERHTFAEN